LSNFFRGRFKSFQYAFSGVLYVIRTQPNAWIHSSFTIGVILLSIWLKISKHDWQIIIIAITLVWIMEFLNTTLEKVVDLIGTDQNVLAKHAKDIGAASVLIAAILSVILGLLSLGPYLWARLQILLH